MRCSRSTVRVNMHRRRRSRLRHLRGLLHEDAPSQVIELVTQADAEVQHAPVDGVISSAEEVDHEDEPEPSLNETVYVDDPQIDLLSA